jgi:YVTN family beta-propeller protein
MRKSRVLFPTFLAALLTSMISGAAFGSTSSPIAITSDDRTIWVVHPDNDSVSFVDVRRDRFKDNPGHTRSIPVGDEPQCIALTPDDRKAYVTNMADGTVSVIDARKRRVTAVIAVGAEPFGCAITPDGAKLFVANFSSDSVSVIDTRNDTVRKTITGVGPKPRAIAIAGDKVYVTQFLADIRPDARPVSEKEGRDDGKEGRVTVISASVESITGGVVLNPLANVGFASNGSVLDRIAATDPPTFTFQTGGFPNQLGSIVVKGSRAYLPNIGASPNGPFRFNVNVQAFLSVFDTTTDADSGQSINMNRGVQFEPPGKRLFLTNPQAIAFKHHSAEGFAVSAATNRLVRVVLADDGSPTINAPTGAGDPGDVIRIEVGANPQGIVINSSDTRAYVMNLVSRDVSVVDISGRPSQYREIARIAKAALPDPGTLEAIVQRGKELFNTSIGPAGTNEEALPPAGRMSNFGWGSCYSCHPSGLTDGVTWLFPDGPRQAISMESTAEHDQIPVVNENGAPLLPSFRQRVLNWSAVRDEVQDFELNIRAVSGGQGLIRDGAAVVNLVPTATTGRDADLDAIAAYIAFGIRAPISPRRGENVAEGRALFAAANCQQCHGGPNWTTSRVDYTPPPLAETITGGQLTRFLFPVGTFDSAAFNEVRGAGTTIVTANGSLGFNVPSLLSVFAGRPYLHSGSAQTLDEVVDNVTHRSAGTSGVDTLSNPADREALVRFLESIDAATPPFP